MRSSPAERAAIGGVLREGGGARGGGERGVSGARGGGDRNGGWGPGLGTGLEQGRAGTSEPLVVGRLEPGWAAAGQGREAAGGAGR